MLSTGIVVKALALSMMAVGVACVSLLALFLLRLNLKNFQREGHQVEVKTIVR